MSKKLSKQEREWWKDEEEYYKKYGKSKETITHYLDDEDDYGGYNFDWHRKANNQEGFWKDFDANKDWKGYNYYKPTDLDYNYIEKMANGEQPNERMLDKEIEGIGIFNRIYNMLPQSAQDWSFVNWVAYKLRPETRDINKEKIAIATFNNVFGTLPDSTIDWAVVRALAYIMN